MNDAGLAVAVLEVAQVKMSEKRFDHNGMPTPSVTSAAGGMFDHQRGPRVLENYRAPG